MKYIVNTAFIDKQNDNKTVLKNDVIEITKKRANEIKKVLGKDALTEVKDTDGK